jgi:hypothetical protein
MARYQSSRSSYIPERDKLLWQRAKGLGNDTLLLVQIYSYDNGVPKVQIAKHDTKKNLHIKVNRITQTELTEALPMLQEAKEVLEKKAFVNVEPLWNEKEGEGDG